MRRTLIGTVVAATAALTVLTMSPAEGAPGKPTGPATAAASAKAAPDRAAATPPAPKAAAAAALATIQTRIAAYVAKHPGAYGFGSYLDRTTGRIVLETDAPAALVSTLTAQPAAATAQRQAVAAAVIRTAGPTDQWHRRDDIPAFYGGGGIVSGGTCSSGYAVQNGAGTRFMVTAGHCFANGASVNTESGANVYGTVSNRRLPTVTGHAQDMELIGGRSYWGRIFTGGVTSSTSQPVVGAGDAVVGYADYCHSGRTTGENCGHTALDNNAQVCTQTGCKQPVTSFNGGVQSTNGDSGSPFYVKDATNVWIRGHILAGNGVTSYAEPWSQVSSAYGVSIVTG